MKPKTMILMVVAVGCGLGASYMTSQYLRANQNKQAPTVPDVMVLVAKKKISGWTPLKEPQEMFELKAYPETHAPTKPISDVAKLKDQRLNKPLEPGDPVTEACLLNAEQAQLVEKLPPGQRAVAIRVNPESLAGGFVLQGHKVDVNLTTRGADGYSGIILQGMLVLAIDMQDKRNPEQTSMIGQTVTLAASPEEAMRLSLAQTVGELRLLPKSQNDNEILPPTFTTVQDLKKPLRTADTEPMEDEKTPSRVEPSPMTLPNIEEKKEPEKPKDKEPKSNPDDDVPPSQNKPNKTRPAVVQPDPEPEPVVRPQRIHTMRIIAGGKVEKHRFDLNKKEDDDTGVDETPTDEPKKTPVKKDEPAKPATKPTTPAPTTTPATRTNGTNRTRTGR